MKSPTYLLDTIDQTLAAAVENFQHYGYVAAVLLIGMGKTQNVVPVPPESLADKDRLEALLCHLARLGMTEFVLVSEQWMLVGPAALAQRQRYRTLAHAPGRIECVGVTYCSAHREIHWWARIERPHGQSPTLGSWLKHENTVGVAQCQHRFSKAIWQRAAAAGN